MGFIPAIASLHSWYFSFIGMAANLLDWYLFYATLHRLSSNLAAYPHSWFMLIALLMLIAASFYFSYQLTLLVDASMWSPLVPYDLHLFL
jgi:hypothetical protein